jgi:hypothetical protein
MAQSNEWSPSLVWFARKIIRYHGGYPQILEKGVASRPVFTSYHSRDALAHACEAQGVVVWGCFLGGNLTKDWLTVQDTRFIIIRSIKMASVWAHGLIKQFWKAAFRLWLHWNSWQHSDDNPQHQRDIEDLDRQITADYTLGAASM